MILGSSATTQMGLSIRAFNETGKATADFGAHDLGHSVAVHGDGRIVVAG